MKNIQIEILNTPFQSEMDESDYVIIWSEDKEHVYRNVVWWDNDEQQLQHQFYPFEPFIMIGKMIAWAKIPYFIENES